jgi:3-oxoacyl-[acyl-carrier protein] reductase
MHVSKNELAGLTAVVTGSSSGIGRAIALELAAAGAELLIHARRSQQAAEAVVTQIRASGGQAELIMADLAHAPGQDELAAQAWRWRPIDIWVNNAGADVLTGEAAKWPFERKLEELWRGDVTATVRLSRDVGRRMKERGSGAIINIGWDQVQHGMAGDSGELFAAAKGAVMAFSRSLALSLAPQVRVNCIAPGWIRTAWGDGASEAWQARARRESQLDRWGTPEDVAKVARFLASPASAFVNAQVVAVNGGFKPA